MNKYYKLYHYSCIAGLKSIDPNYYGTGVARRTECKYGKSGLNKSYYYTKDDPEICVKSQNRYEIYMPYDWRAQIYDLSKDPYQLHQSIKQNIEQQYHRQAYLHELKDEVELLIKQLRFKGWKASDYSPLPHVTTLFLPLSTEKPENGIVYDWDNQVIEKFKENRCLFFSNPDRNLLLKDNSCPIIDVNAMQP